MTRRVIYLAIVLLALGSLNCRQTSKTSVAVSTTTPTQPPVPTSTPTPVPTLRSPLTGLLVKDASLLRRRPLAVKFDNAPAARPQSGLAAAAIVYEHLTEGGITRFTAIYLTEDVETIGPIRSARLVDLELVAQYQALFAHIGASQPVMEMIRSSGIRDLDQFWYPQAYYRSPRRSSPYNVYTSTPVLRELARQKGWEGAIILGSFKFDSRVLEPAAGLVSYIAVPFSDSSYVEYRYDSARGTYLRFIGGQPHVDANDGQQIQVNNVIVQRVKTYVTDIVVNGDRLLKHELMGEGRAVVFRNGRAYPARWVRKASAELTQFLDDSGMVIPFEPGNTWVELVSKDMEIITDH